MTPGNVEGILGALGGIGIFAGAVWAVIRAAFKMRMSTDANTEALQELTKTVTQLTGRVDRHDIDISVLKDRFQR